MAELPPKVSIIAPVHNAVGHVADLLRRLSELLQNDRELVIVDDGSSDGSSEQLQLFASTHPSVRLITNAVPQGAAKARNAALAVARGDYVWFVDDDDLWEPRILEVFLRAAGESGADIVICRAELRRAGQSRGQIIDGLPGESVVDRNSAWQSVLEGRINGYLWNKFFARHLLTATLFEDLRSQSDFTGVVKAVAGASAVHFIPEVLYFHVIREGSITRRKDPDLSNLRRAFDVAMVLHRTQIGRVPDMDTDYFSVWFLAFPFSHTPTRVRASWTLRREGIRQARDVLRVVDLDDVRRRARSDFVKASLVLRLGPLYLPLLEAAQFSRRLSRKVGSQ